MWKTMISLLACVTLAIGVTAQAQQQPAPQSSAPPAAAPAPALPYGAPIGIEDAKKAA